jgi:hypothetical protein
VGCPRRQGGGGRRKLGVVVARAREARKGGEQEWGRQGVMRGREIQQEVALGGPAPAVSGGGRAEQEREAVVPKVEEAGRSQKDLFVISKKCGDLSVN